MTEISLQVEERTDGTDGNNHEICIWGEIILRIVGKIGNKNLLEMSREQLGRLYCAGCPCTKEHANYIYCDSFTGERK